MALQSKAFLEVLFANGARPDQVAFQAIFDSFLHKTEDVNFDDATAALSLGGGVTVGDADNGLPDGTIRFRGGQFEFKYNGNWEPLGTGSGGAFAPLTANDPHVVYNGGNVGIGLPVSPTFKFEVELAANSSAGNPAEQVRLGHAAIGRGSGTRANLAMFAHRQHATNNNFAVAQDVTGEVTIHAPDTTTSQGSFERVLLKQGTISRTSRLALTRDGNVAINSDNDVTGSSGQVFQVNGGAFKNDGRSSWDITSDARVKEDVKPFEDGLNMLKAVQPVHFTYNGKAGTQKGQQSVGVLAQEIAKVFPYMVHGGKGKLDDSDEQETDILNFNASSLSYVMLNAIKELAAKVESLEAQLEEK